MFVNALRIGVGKMKFMQLVIESRKAIIININYSPVHHPMKFSVFPPEELGA